METLPLDLLSLIGLRLDIVNLSSFCQINRRLASLGRDPVFWRLKIQRDFPDSVAETENPQERYLRLTLMTWKFPLANQQLWNLDREYQHLQTRMIEIRNQYQNEERRTRRLAENLRLSLLFRTFKPIRVKLVVSSRQFNQIHREARRLQQGDSQPLTRFQNLVDEIIGTHLELTNGLLLFVHLQKDENELGYRPDLLFFYEDLTGTLRLDQSNAGYLPLELTRICNRLGWDQNVLEQFKLKNISST